MKKLLIPLVLSSVLINPVIANELKEGEIIKRNMRPVEPIQKDEAVPKEDNYKQ